MIELRGIKKSYQRGAEEVHALRGIDLTIGRSEFVSVVGPSGAGKSSLLHILGCLDRPTGGTVSFDGLSVEGMTEAELVHIRRKRIGFIFQQFCLMPGLSVYDNITLPAVFGRQAVERGRVMSLIETVGLGNRAHHLPAQLSGGEMQRAAIARALVNAPDIVLADEPTGNLDSGTTERIFELLIRLNEQGFTIIMVTHNEGLALRTGRMIRMKDGLILA